MNNTLQISTIDFISMQSNRIPYQIYNILILLKRPKIVYSSQTVEQEPWIKKLSPDSKKNSCSWG